MHVNPLYICQDKVCLSGFDIFDVAPDNLTAPLPSSCLTDVGKGKSGGSSQIHIHMVCVHI